MSKLDDILEEYRKTCFLAKDNLDSKHDESIELLAKQNMITKMQIKFFLREILSEMPIESREEILKKVEEL